MWQGYQCDGLSIAEPDSIMYDVDKFRFPQPGIVELSDDDRMTRKFKDIFDTNFSLLCVRNRQKSWEVCKGLSKFVDDTLNGFYLW